MKEKLEKEEREWRDKLEMERSRTLNKVIEEEKCLTDCFFHLYT